jgi:hypothetical protein
MGTSLVPAVVFAYFGHTHEFPNKESSKYEQSLPLKGLCKHKMSRSKFFVGTYYLPSVAGYLRQRFTHLFPSFFLSVELNLFESLSNGSHVRMQNHNQDLVFNRSTE